MARVDPRLLVGSSGGQPTAGGTGGSAGQASTCRDQSGQILPELKRCATDDDCELVATYSCCGPGPIIGLAKTAEAVIPGCFTTSYPEDSPPLGCSSQATTEDGQALGTGDLSSVVARCFEVAPAQKACMTMCAAPACTT